MVHSLSASNSALVRGSLLNLLRGFHDTVHSEELVRKLVFLLIISLSAFKMYSRILLLCIC